ncbi:putative CHY-type Zn-finger protein [Effusibacillus lacus]|nr:putative CHY-type Zn-finger protein [Effusibacillus lacus]
MRGHHLLCLLGYRGIGYSEQFARNMSSVHDRLLKDPETEVCIVQGPDDLCACFPDDQVYHCDDEHVGTRDQRILQRLGLEIGEELTWGEIQSRIARLVNPEEIAEWCFTCSWRSLGYCEEGVRRIRAGHGLVPLPARIHGVEVYGVQVDSQTRCGHYASDRDIIAIRFPCCDTYYPCYQCHQAVAGHPAATWSTEQFDRKAILCGACGTELTINQYLACDSVCPYCGSQLNPGCKNHYHLYFER